MLIQEVRSLKICGGIFILNIQLDFSMIYDYEVSEFFFFLIEFIIDSSKLKTHPYFPSHITLFFFFPPLCSPKRLQMPLPGAECHYIKNAL